MIRFLAAIICITLLNFSCSKQQEEVTGIVKDYTGLDGCGLVIVLDNGTDLEPVSLPANVTLIADRRVSLTYRTLTDRASNCMIGPIVKVVSLRYL
ncbi:MAG: hypothetical protein ACT4OJ_06835 [Bacteroidota bacterium]